MPARCCRAGREGRGSCFAPVEAFGLLPAEPFELARHEIGWCEIVARVGEEGSGTLRAQVMGMHDKQLDRLGLLLDSMPAHQVLQHGAGAAPQPVAKLYLIQPLALLGGCFAALLL